jgi:hypothetical protein
VTQVRRHTEAGASVLKGRSVPFRHRALAVPTSTPTPRSLRSGSFRDRDQRADVRICEYADDRKIDRRPVRLQPLLHATPLRRRNADAPERHVQGRRANRPTDRRLTPRGASHMRSGRSAHGTPVMWAFFDLNCAFWRVVPCEVRHQRRREGRSQSCGIGFRAC